MPAYIAPARTRVELDAARTIASGNTIRVLGIIVCNATASNVEVHFNDVDGTEILSIAVLAHDSKESRIAWLADNGLSIASASDANVSVTVFHTSQA